MRNYLHHKECLVYPGEYAALPERRELLDKLQLNYKEVVHPPVNMDEFEGFYRIEILIPGVRREDIFVYINTNNILSVAVLYKETTNGKKKLQIHEFDTRYLERRIPLPENADTGFVSAEYHEGILRFCIPKTEGEIKPVKQQIVVY